MKNRPISCIRCGDIFLANFDHVGGKRKGIKPVLVIQKDKVDRSDFRILSAPLIPISDTYAQSTHIILEKGSGLKWRSIVCIEEVCVLSRRHFGRYVGHIGRDKVCLVRNALYRRGSQSGIHARDSPSRTPANWPSGGMELCLCPVCVSAFFNAQRYIVRQKDRNQVLTDTCTVCQVRQGFDYIITEREWR